jgi:molybdopterin-guanine dinucleotide biosynthesis protein A
MNDENKVTGVVLAGGLSRRMQQDKGLLRLHNRPMIRYALDVMLEVADDVVISTNQHQEEYLKFGYPVIADQTSSFDGPLAGILSAMDYAQTDILLVMPCDSPRVEARHLRRLLHALTSYDELAVVMTFGRIHPVFLAVRTALKTDLQAYLQRGERKMQSWLEQHRLLKVDFSDDAEAFVNINTPAEWTALEHSQPPFSTKP